MRNMAQLAMERATIQTQGRVTCVCLIDVVGPRPIPDQNVYLKAALEELNQREGWDDVKREVNLLLTIVQNNYTRELAGTIPHH